MLLGNDDLSSFICLACTYKYADCGITKILIYVQLKQYITESIGLTNINTDIDTDTDTNTKHKLDIGLDSHKKWY